MDGYVDLTYGNYNYIQANAAVSIPISDTLGLRLSGQIRRRDGYTRNLAGQDFDNVDTTTGRIFLRWEPMAGLRNDLVYNYYVGKSNGIGTILVAVRPGPPLVQSRRRG